MYNEKWFKFLVWSMASFFFFLNACIIIGTLGPPPSEGQIHLWMSEMMKAMHQSMMGYSMQLEEGSALAYLLYESSQLILPLALGGLLAGLLLRSKIKHGKK